MERITDGVSLSGVYSPAIATEARPITILFLAANPANTAPLKLDEEVRAIDLALRQADFRDRFRLEQHWAVRVTEIQALLLRYRPDIVHFSGHGSADNELIFLDDEGNPQAVTPVAFGRLFALLTDNIRCVVLNACHSAVQAEAIAQHIDAVVGVSQVIGDKASIQFASAFYQALGFGRSVKSAFDLGRSQIELANLGYEGTPQLITQRIDPSQLVFVPDGRKKMVDQAGGHARSNRAAMLRLVADFWIDGVLRPSLYREVLLGLDMKVSADAVHSRLWNMVVQRPQTPDRVLPSGAGIGAVFEEMHRSLLILGEPGSGKTTTLLDLARVALVRGKGDPAEPIPVVFNLASWVERRLPLAEWLVEELRNKYQIPAGVAGPWVAQNELLLLLDGLDQVQTAHQAECVKAINDFLEQHLVAVAICCRADDYAALNTPLNVRGAIVLQPLSAEQILEFLTAVGLEKSLFTEELVRDPILQQLAQSPLMLSIMAFAHSNSPATSDKLQVAQSNDRRKQIFDLYIAQMLTRRTSVGQYSPTQSKRWLGWLAQGMARHGEVQFLIENLQPTWLSTRGDKRLYAVGFRVLSGLLFPVVCVLAGVLTLVTGNMTLAEGLTAGFIVGGLFMVSYAVAGLLGFWVPRWLAVALTVGLIALCTIPIAALGGTIMAGLVLSLVIGLPAALAAVASTTDDAIIPADRLSWSWKKARYGLAIALGATLIVGLSAALMGNRSKAVGDALTAGFMIAPAAVLITGLTRALTVPQTTIPNQGINQSIHRALLVAALVLIVVAGAGTIWGVVYRSDVRIGLGFGLIFAFPIALAAGLAQGGIPSLQHLVLRLILYWRGALPWNLSRFLDSAVERILLRKVGGGYIFVHSLLGDYFAKDAEGLRQPGLRFSP